MLIDGNKWRGHWHPGCFVNVLGYRIEYSRRMESPGYEFCGVMGAEGEREWSAVVTLIGKAARLVNKYLLGMPPDDSTYLTNDVWGFHIDYERLGRTHIMSVRPDCNDEGFTAEDTDKVQVVRDTMNYIWRTSQEYYRTCPHNLIKEHDKTALLLPDNWQEFGGIRWDDKFMVGTAEIVGGMSDAYMRKLEL